jgi:hypothetical protein
LYVDVLASFENLALTPLRRLAGPCGQVRISSVEELIVERVLIASRIATNRAKDKLTIPVLRDALTTTQSVKRRATKK